MSAIPPGWLGSVIQTQGAQSRAAEARKREEASQPDAAHEVALKNGLTDAISNNDQDSSVFADGHGAGSQGRATSDGSEQEAPADDAAKPAGDGLDIEA